MYVHSRPSAFATDYSRRARETPFFFSSPRNASETFLSFARAAKAAGHICSSFHLRHRTTTVTKSARHATADTKSTSEKASLEVSNPVGRFIPNTPTTMEKAPTASAPPRRLWHRMACDTAGVGVTYEFDAVGLDWFKSGSVSLLWDAMYFSYDDFRDVTRSGYLPGQEPLYDFNANVTRLFMNVRY